MTAILDAFIRFWKYWMFISFVIGLIGFGILFFSKTVNSERKKKVRKIGIVLFGQTLLTWIIGFGTLWIIQSQAKHEIIDFLNQENLIIEINDEIIDSNESVKIIKELKTIKNIGAHHSSPTNEIKIKISSNNNSVNLILKQDSEFENEYWVYLDKYKTTMSNEIGRIRTEIFKIINSS